MRTTIAFGKTGLELDLPEGPQYQVLRAHSAPPIAHVESALEAALTAPVAGKSLAQLAAGKKSAAISVCDITRPAPNKLTLPPILRCLHASGLRAENITLCIATGLHREATGAELDAILGPEIAARYPIFNHDARLLEAHRYLGETARGTPVWVANRFFDADLHITLGFIEQHLMLGFSGGRKLIAPGLAAQETIKVIHSPGFMREPMAVEGSIEQNPIHADLLEIARMARHNFLLDVTLTREREISGIFAGEPVAAHAGGVEFVRQSSIEYVPEFFDAAITSAAGFPLDMNFYQTVKGMTAAQHIVKPRGKILTFSECSEGAGSVEFSAMVAAYNGAQPFLDAIHHAPVTPDQWQLEKLALVELANPLTFYLPGIAAASLGSLAAHTFETPAEAMADLVADLLPGARVAVLPDGPYACVRVQAQ